MTRQTKWEWPEASTVDMSQFSLILVVEDGSVASISVEKLEMLNQVWVGMGSISGFEMTISLSENTETSSYLKRRQLSSNQVPNCLEDMVPDGAIVAIQDVHQHLYFAVEERESKNSLTGVIHYSLVGEKTLFRALLLARLGYCIGLTNNENLHPFSYVV
ncbi:hypothetical protein OIU77_003366 [Salix suchowensis]|uniref:Uncharacterized protein n=1 Tax=Salix suchowensis TaxID=1278906 RepID=A0ABQ9B2F9_9ROSI|nr:hypothetical protein OIU77_003366 [Salix suchowensis]